MKKNIIISALSAVLMLVASCQKTLVNNGKESEGYLSFSEFVLELDEELETKADPADGGYTIIILDADNNQVLVKNYSEVKKGDYKISLPEGMYTLVARSKEEIPTVKFEYPVYGVSKSFAIEAGKTTLIGELTCTLLQCKVTVSYSDDFLAMVTGPGVTKVEVKSGYPLEYSLNADKTYEEREGFFDVEGNTMTVSFKGSIDGKTMTMTKVFSGIAVKQWRKIKFVPKTNEQGAATFDIIINDLISDEVLDNDMTAEEDVIAPDPNAPKDDGGIKMLLADDCDPTITYSEENIVYDADGNKINSTGLIYVPVRKLADDGSMTMNIKFDAVIPSGLAELTVDIESDSPAFRAAVTEANAAHIDLVNPECDPIIFDVVPFKRGNEILGATEIEYDLSSAQQPILGFPGTHVFTMTIVDENGKSKVNKVTMVVE